MRVGVDLPYFAHPVEIRDYVQAAEGLGYSHIGFSEHIVSSSAETFPPGLSFDEPWHESFTLLAFLAAITQRVELNTGMTLLTLRPAALAAKQAAEVDLLSGGRLRLGVSVVADSCNPIEITRREWEQVARETRAVHVNIEVICSDSGEHRLRAEARHAEVSGLKLPTWSEIENREYDEWTVERVIVDTAGRSKIECASELLSKLSWLRAEQIVGPECG